MEYTIIGAGIGGLTTALAFEKKGIKYQIFEKAPQLKKVGAGIWLAPNALQVFEDIGLLEKIKANGSSINRITIGTPDLSPISDNLQGKIKNIFGYSSIAIHRAKLQELLFNEIPKEKIHLDKSFTRFEQLDSGKIKVEFKDSTKIVTDLLVGADGIHSNVRKQLFTESKIRFSGQTCWRGVASFDLSKELENRVFELWGNQIRFGYSKIAKNSVYWFAVALDKPNQKNHKEIVKEKLTSMFADFAPLINELITATPTEKILRNDLCDLSILDSWYKENICLIGDAAHAMTPNMGQGGGQAIEDAHYLSSLIAKYPEENIFERFQQKRKKKVDAVVNESWMAGKMAHWKYGQSLRNFFMRRIPKKILEKKMIDLYQIEKIL